LFVSESVPRRRRAVAVDCRAATRSRFRLGSERFPAAARSAELVVSPSSARRNAARRPRRGALSRAAGPGRAGQGRAGRGGSAGTAWRSSKRNASKPLHPAAAPPPLGSTPPPARRRRFSSRRRRPRRAGRTAPLPAAFKPPSRLRGRGTTATPQRAAVSANAERRVHADAANAVQPVAADLDDDVASSLTPD